MALRRSLAQILVLVSLLVPAAASAATDAALLSGALGALKTTSEGARLVSFLEREKVAVRFAPCGLGRLNATACYDYRTRVIKLAPALRQAPAEYVASFIAHEATHAARAARAEAAHRHAHTAAARARVMIGEELAAYRVQARLWNELRRSQGLMAQLFGGDDRTLAMDRLAGWLERAPDAAASAYIAKNLGYANYYQAAAQVGGVSPK